MNDQNYMRRALELARLGIGYVSPNPAVGAVIVHDGVIIGEGFHQLYGKAHAEVNAINDVINKELLPQSTMYVTLEPCSHWGKTPPCADLIIKNRIKRVVIGVVDPFSEVCGNGIKKLQSANIEVLVGVLESECIEINAPFFTMNHKKRPYIILKWAQSKDGFIDIKRPQGSDAKWFTGFDCKTLVHKWRSEVGCIMVGRKTVEMDNPELNARAYFGKNPVRATIDADLKLKTTYKIFNDAANTLLFTKCDNFEVAKLKFAEHKNVEIVALDWQQNIPLQICKYLYNRSISELFIEGGTKLIDSFVGADLWDEARVFTSNYTIDQIYDFDKNIDKILAPKIVGIEKSRLKYQICDFKVLISE